MSDQTKTLTFKVLCVASPDVLGETKPLSVAAPCRFSNAEGHLRRVESFGEITATAAKSARRFMDAGFNRPDAE